LLFHIIIEDGKKESKREQHEITEKEKEEQIPDLQRCKMKSWFFEERRNIH